MPAATDGERITIEQRVRDVPVDGEVTYHLVIEPGGARVVSGAAASPVMTVITDYETARALHDGRTTAQRALATGRYKIKGRLVSLRALFELDDVFGAVRGRTTYP